MDSETGATVEPDENALIGFALLSLDDGEGVDDDRPEWDLYKLAKF